MPHSILVVDDEPAIAESVAELLADEGYRVTMAHDGRAALALFDANPPDLVISDVMMPHIDGVRLALILRARGDMTPVLLISAVYAGIDIAGVRFLSKPFDLEHLLRIVAMAIEETG